MKESLDQDGIDDLLNKLQGDGTASKGTQSKTDSTVVVVSMKCIHCGYKYAMSYDKSKEKPISGYCVSVRNWRGKPCTSSCGHAFFSAK